MYPNSRGWLVMAVLVLVVGLWGESSVAMESSGGPLIVHEWGTFTNFAGADGKQRPFGTYVGSGHELPDFVMTWDEGGGSGAQRRIDAARMTKSVVREVAGRQRMETPVIYFYSGCPWEVDVEATILNGQMTEFYPPLSGFGGGDAQGKADRSIVRWENVQVRSDSPAGELAAKLPSDAGATDSHYFAARATDSRIISTQALGATHHERFLFYRGVADFESKVMVKALGGDRFEILNSTGETIVAAIAMSVEDGKVRWAASHGIGPRVVFGPDSQDRGVDSLAREMEKTLTAAGLYEREAAAMVKTWRGAWFSEPGMRVLYIMPRGDVDRVVPLKITPKPEQLVRVFVGRMDVLTPEVEARMSQTLAKMEGADEARRNELGKELPKLGRFQQPALERIRESATDPKVVAQAGRVLGR
jgi:hypothetical protein